jgi:hypothetical protein
MDDTAFLPTKGEYYRGGIWKHQEEKSEEPPDSAAAGDIDAVEKEMEDKAQGDETPKEESAENSESTDAVEQLEPKRRMRTTLRSPVGDAATPKVASEQNLRSRMGRSASFTSVASAPAVVATDPVNVIGTSPSRDTVDWAAEAAARAIAQKAKASESPRLSADVPGDLLEPTPSLPEIVSTSEEEKASTESMRDEVPMTLENNSEPVLSKPDPAVAGKLSRSSTPSSRFGLANKDALFSTRVSQATDAAKDMLRTRLNTYLAKRQQSKLQKQILTNDRDLLVNSMKPRTRLPSDTSPELASKPDDEDIDSGPLPFENKKSPLFAPSEFGSLQSPGYGPSVMMTIPSTMANARPTVPETTTSGSSPTPPPLPERSPSARKLVPPPLPARSTPRAIPRRPVPQTPQHSHDVESSGPSAATSPEDARDHAISQNGTDEDDLMVLHIDDDEEQEQASRTSSVKNFDLGTSPDRRRVEREEEAVLEPSSYSSNKSRRPSMVKEPSTASQWKGGQDAERDMPEMVAEGLMG